MFKSNHTKKTVSVVVTMVLIFSAVNCVLLPQKTSAAFTNFITRHGDELRDGDSLFQFVGFNVPVVTAHKDTGSFGNLDDWELEDLLLSCTQMGVNVVRTYTMPIGTSVTGNAAYVTGIRTYNEDNMKRLDKFLELAEKHNIRVIFPFIDCYSHKGGLREFSSFRGKNSWEFFSDETLKQDYRNLVYDMLNRTNAYTGVKYKDNKTILAWEFGNELDGNTSWTGAWEDEMGAYIKSLDANHLVLSSAHDKGTLNAAVLASEHIDILTCHPYGIAGRSSPVAANTHINACKGKKPFIMGEFDEPNAATFISVFEKITPANSCFAGALVWSLRGRTSIGGFYQHNEGQPTWYSYNWPGGAEGEALHYEITKINGLRSHAYRVRGLTVPPIPAPPAPIMLSSSTKSAIRFKGSTGAVTYEIQRATNPNGPWETLTTTYRDYGQAYDHDVITPYQPYNDTTAPECTVYYRARGANSDGVYGEYSDVLDITNLTNTIQLVNPGFENDAEGWILGSHFSITDTEKHSGSKALKLTGTGDWCSAQYHNIPVTANAVYNLTFWAKSTSSNSNYKILAQSSSTVIREAFLSGNNTWKQYSVTFNSGSNTVVRIYLGDGGGTVYYDDFELTLTAAPTPPPTPSPKMRVELEPNVISPGNVIKTVAVTDAGFTGTAKLITAVYDGNNLVACKIADVDESDFTNAVARIDVNLTIPDHDYSDLLVKTMLWNNSDIITPLLPSFAYSETQPLDSLKVLAIGNSFSENAITWLDDIAINNGVDITIGSLAIGGCKLSRHADNAAANRVDYSYYKTVNGKSAASFSATLEDGLLDDDWDVITLQQVSDFSGKPETFDPYLEQLINYIKERRPDAKIAWHMTWAYQQNSNHSAFPSYNSDQMTMYNAIVNAVQTRILPDTGIDIVIPSGTAVQNVRTSSIGDTLTSDGYHLSNPLGCYIAGMTWYHALTRQPVDDLTWVPNTSVTPAALSIVKESVQNATLAPLEITQSTYK